MPKENLLRLSLKLLATPLAEKRTVYLSHKGYASETTKLSADLRIEVEELMEELRNSIPNDFAFFIFFGMKGADLVIEFEDGNVGTGAGGGVFTSRKSMMRKQRSTDWDAIRLAAIQRAEAFDEVVNEAEDRPANIPSSESAAEKWGVRLIQEIGKNRRLNPRSPFTLIVGRDNRISSEQLSSREGVIGAIGDCMATGYDILAVLEVCSPWDYELVETAKRQAIDGLGPISKAKAEGRLRM